MGSSMPRASASWARTSTSWAAARRPGAARREQRSGKLYGYIDLTGRYAIAPAFAWADDFREGRALARRGDQLMYIDPRGQAAASFSLVCGAVVIRDAQQRVTWPAKPLSCPDAAGLQYAPATETAQAGQS